MCGISGILNSSANNKVKIEELNSMLKTIKHRGPNDEGQFIDDNVALGHVRLSIIDLSQDGHQPMFSTDNRFCIIFNGEIYNYIEIKQELKASYSFRSKSDTEVILAAYLKWGKDFLHKLNGDFSFAIYDTYTKELFAARDRYGIKPFYYFQTNKSIYFASEIKALLPALRAKTNINVNNDAIFNYVVYGRTDYGSDTFFSQIKKLPHGHYFTWQKGQLNIHKWYSLEEEINKHSQQTTPEEYFDILVNSIKLRLRSDVPVGISLSGGLDSSCITSIIAKTLGHPDIQTFSATYEKGSWADESEYINAYKGIIDKMNYIQPNAKSFLNDIPTFIKAHNEPVSDLGPYSQFKVMQLASSSVTVTLDGQGADEQLAGYHNFFGSYYRELLTSFHLLRLANEATQYWKKHNKHTPFSFLAFYLLPKNLKDKVLSKQNTLNKDFYNQYKTNSNIAQQLYSPKTLNDSLISHFNYKIEHLLRWDDLNSMAFSLESRVPFMDHNLVEKTLALAPKYKIKDGTTKSILRDATQNLLPPIIKERQDKKGFTTPSDEWLRDKKVQNYIFDTIRSKKFQDRKLFESTTCETKYLKHINGEGNYSKEIWRWVNLEQWFNLFVD